MRLGVGSEFHDVADREVRTGGGACDAGMLTELCVGDGHDDLWRQSTMRAAEQATVDRGIQEGLERVVVPLTLRSMVPVGCLFQQLRVGIAVIAFG
ncbi:MAG: hypothetical protein NTW76_04850 [Corynebacteriales bacterium]|nr:hypothetical protein [Mycobacteriales bacterium]